MVRERIMSVRPWSYSASWLEAEVEAGKTAPAIAAILKCAIYLFICFCWLLDSLKEIKICSNLFAINGKLNLPYRNQTIL